MLSPCHHCSRHIREHERVCPFCHAAVEAAPAKTLQRVAAAAAVALTVASCESYRPATKYGGPPLPPPVDPVATQPASTPTSLEAQPPKKTPREEMKEIYGAPPPPPKKP